MNQPCAHWARSWHSHYGVRRNPGTFYVFLHFKKISKPDAGDRSEQGGSVIEM